MRNSEIVDRTEWIEARKALLAEEKQFTKARDALNARRWSLPRVRIDIPYLFETVSGPKTLVELFEGRRQLIIYHFMYGPDWAQGCKSCSFWADSFEGISVHLADRDTAFVAVSRAPLAKLDAFKQRMGWSFEWVSSAPSQFNFDFGVSFDPDTIKAGQANYNYRKFEAETDEMPGISLFSLGEDGAVFHTYSTFARGLDLMNTAYNFLDLTPSGRGEQGLGFTMSWVKLHDGY
jgi:predicted dithiol-disulfide oxidoreductase (DUF899 family)